MSNLFLSLLWHTMASYLGVSNSLTSLHSMVQSALLEAFSRATDEFKPGGNGATCFNMFMNSSILVL
jgi:hypothetical protein